MNENELKCDTYILYFQYHDILLSLARKERFHCCDHRNIQRDSSSISANVGSTWTHQ